MQPTGMLPFRDEESAYRFVERRVWPDGPVCPRCGTSHRIGKMAGMSTRIGTYKCYQCRKPFTVKIGTILESSHVPLHAWLKAIYLLRMSDGIGVYQLHRILGVAPKTVLFMVKRINQARRRGSPPLAPEAAPESEGEHRS